MNILNNVLDNIIKAFQNFSYIDVVDILLFAIIFYLVFAILKYNNLHSIFKYCLIVFLIILILSSKILDLKYTKNLLNYSILIICIGLIVIFSQDIKNWLWKISVKYNNNSSFNIDYGCTDEQLLQAVDEIVKAVLSLAKKEIGALIIIENSINEQIINSGTQLDSLVTSPLLESIFITKGPLHDGAVVIHGNRIVSAGCFLPLSQSAHISKELGTRHRAALGVTENTSVFAIIVSEETGVISVAQNGELQRYYDGLMLLEELKRVYGIKAIEEDTNKRWL